MTAPLDITALLSHPEGQHFERKTLFEGPDGAKKNRDRRSVRDEIAKHVASFANAEGGVLVYGQEDDLSISGCPYPDDATAEMLRVPESRLKPPQPPGIAVEHAGKKLLVFDVPTSDVPVTVTGGGVPLRIGDSTVQVNESEVKARKLHGLAESWESKPSDVELDQLDRSLIGKASQGAGLAGLGTIDYLVKRKLADRRGKNLVLRRAAELLFAPTIDHPNAGIRLFRVVGTTRLTGARHNVEERPRIEGNLPSILDEGFKIIDGLIRKPARLVGNKFRTVPEYPEFSWKESILNAVAHRDYSVQGACVEVWLFDDRMEVVSPGGLMPEVPLEDLLHRKRVHASRNPRLARCLVDLGFMRDQGEGIPRLFAEMEGLFLPEPTLIADKHRFTIVLRNTPTVSAEDGAWLASLSKDDLSDQECRALLEARRAGRIGNGRLRQMTGLDTLGASAMLRRLRDQGLLKIQGKGAHSHYVLAAPPDKPVSGQAAPPTTPVSGQVAPPNTAVSGQAAPPDAPVSAQAATPNTRVSAQARPEIPPDLDLELRRLGPRARPPILDTMIVALCRVRPFKAGELAHLFKRSNVRKFTQAHLARLVSAGRLRRAFPEVPKHPDQAYVAVPQPTPQ